MLRIPGFSIVGSAVSPVRAGALMVAVLLGSATLLPAQQVTPDQMAQMTLDSARKAYNEKNYPFAVQRFREFLAKFGGHKDLPIARYGLALSLLDSPEKDYPAAFEQLNALVGMKEFPEHPFVLYYTGAAQRGIGVRTLAQIAMKPQEAPQLRAQANQRFEEAAKMFAAAAPVFAARVKEVAPDAKELPLDMEWSARSRCDAAEMLLRLQKNKEAREAVAPFAAKDVLTKSRYRGLGLYYNGFASFLLNDIPAAARSLTQLAPYNDPIFGNHARYLMARTHHVADERAEAAKNYEGVTTDYAAQKAQAAQMLQQPQTFNNDPEIRARLQGLVSNPPPDHVARSNFYLGVLQYEAGKFGEALGKFAAFPQQFPGSPLLIEALLRQGFCQVQTKDYANALKTLQPIFEKEPRLADQALLWFGKAQVGSADPANAQTYPQVLTAAMNSFRQAAERSQQMIQADPEAKARRGEALLELADTHQLAKQYKEAAQLYEQIINEKPIPARDEEVHQRRITALHLAGDYAGSDQGCARFVQTYPKSTLMPAVLFRFAENAYFTGLAAEKIPDVAQRQKETTRLYDEAGKRYATVIEKFPEFQYVSLARHGLGLTYYRKGEFDKARAAFEAIPGPDRGGDLVVVPYLVADCLIRLAPTKIEDQLAAGKLQEQLGKAAESLEGYIGADPKGPRTADALIKLGLCQQKLATLAPDVNERNKVLTAARNNYAKLQKEFPQDPLVPQSIMEAAKTQAQMGDKGGAINELRRFSTAPLQAAPVAPMATLQLATLLREINQAPEAAKVLGECRQQQEANLAKDPERAPWVWLLQYHHGVALRESGKLPEARALFDGVVKQAGNRPEAVDASLRLGQCLQQEGLLAIDAGKKAAAQPNLKPEQIAAANKQIEDGWKGIRDSVTYFEQQAEAWRQKMPAADARARMHYEAAWGHRRLAEPEVAAARAKAQQDLLKKQQEEAVKKDPTWKPPAVVELPEVPLTAVPLQPSEGKARDHYKALIAAYTDLPLAIDARFELAELLSERAEYDAAAQLINQALDKEPAQELSDKLRLRLAAILQAKKDTKGALAQFDVVANNPKSPLSGLAHYRAGECLMEMGDPTKASQRFAIFRDQPMYHNIPNVSDRALLRLGHALAALNQWDASRQAHEALVGRFGGSPWVHEGRYGIGWAWQNAKQFDNAVNAYTPVANAVATELGARAQLQIGLCRLEQKRFPEAAQALLVVPFTFDYPDLSAVALVEAARCHVEQNQKDQAEKLLNRVIKDHPKSKWAEVARERLQTLKKG